MTYVGKGIETVPVELRHSHHDEEKTIGADN